MLTTRLFKACAEIGNVCSRRLTSGAAIEYPLHRLQTVINHDVCQNLINNGFAVVDNVFGASYASILREEVQAVRDHMHLNCTHLVMNEADGGAAHRHLVPKSNIFEAELQDVNVQRLAPTCALLQTDPTLRVMIGLFLPQSRFSSHAIKLQWNAGNGACFPIHFDTDGSVDTRTITAIFYLNQGWMPRDGGQLRLYPFPQSSSLDIDPIHDRLVLFTSRTMLHRVLPSQKERYCFTIWISQRNDSMSFNSRAMVMNEREAARAALMGVKDSKNRNELWEILRMEEVRKHAIKWVFREEWLASLIQSHPSGKEQTALIDRFKNEITVVEQALRPLLPILEEWRSVSGRKNGSMPRSPYPAAQWL